MRNVVMRRRHRLLSVVVLGMLAGCATEQATEVAGQGNEGPTLLRSLPMITVAAAQLPEYWQWQQPMEVVAPVSAGRNVQFGCVAVHFGIDADGRSFDVQVRKSYPQGRFVAPVLALAQQWRFTPTALNPVRQPVRTDRIVTMQAVDGEVRFVDVEHVAKLCR